MWSYATPLSRLFWNFLAMATGVSPMPWCELAGASTTSGCYASCAKNGGSGHLKRQFVPTTDSHHPFQVYPNLVKGLQVDAPDVVWVADITYIRLLSNFVYLAALLDAYSRKCVGWNLSKRIDTQLALGALEQALATRDVRPGLIHHSDRGVQYASHAYVERLLNVQAKISMSALGNPYDN